MAHPNRSLLRILLLLSTVICLTGCWDRTETNDLAFVLSSSVDLEEDGQYRVAYLLPLPGQMGGASGGGGGTSGGNSYYIDSEVGSTFRECTTKLQKRIARRIFLSHRRTIVIGEELAKQGISSLFDTIPRLPESRLNTFLVVTKGKGYDLLKAQPKFERFSAEAIRELAKSPYTMPLTTKDVGLALSYQSDPIISYMQVKDSEKDTKVSKEIELSGYAQFHQDKMVGVYEEETATGLMYLRNELHNQMVTFPLESNKNISILVNESSTRISPTIQDGKVSFEVNVDLIGKVREDHAEMDLNESAVAHMIEKELSNHTKKSIRDVITQMQTAGTDSAHLGLLVWRKFPYEWKHGIEEDWHEVFKHAEFHIQVDSSISETGLVNQNLLKDGLNNE